MTGQHDSSLTPRVLLAVMRQTIMVMLGRIPMNIAFSMTTQGLWQAIWASVIIAFLVSVYPLSGAGFGLLIGKMAAQMISVVVLSLIVMRLLRIMGLAEKTIGFLVPFIWFENVQYLLAGIVAYMMMIAGSDQVPVLFFGPLLIWTVYWLWRAGRDQLGRGGWVATGFLALSMLVDTVITFALLSRIHLAAG